MFLNFNNKTKIKYIECWIHAKNCTLTQVASFLKIEENFLRLIITEYENNDKCIIIDSKMNYM